jgi:hypothetical protein
MFIKIISGGQTGIDRMALEVARELGIPTGGSAPRDFMTEKGPDLSLATFGLVALLNKEYAARTRKNVLDGDGTVIYGDLIGGTRLTLEFCRELEKPHIVNPRAEDLVDFIRTKRIEVLNVAGNRGSKMADVRLAEYRQRLRKALIMVR